MYPTPSVFIQQRNTKTNELYCTFYVLDKKSGSEKENRQKSGVLVVELQRT